MSFINFDLRGIDLRGIIKDIISGNKAFKLFIIIFITFIGTIIYLIGVSIPLRLQIADYTVSVSLTAEHDRQQVKYDKQQVKYGKLQTEYYKLLEQAKNPDVETVTGALSRMNWHSEGSEEVRGMRPRRVGPWSLPQTMLLTYGLAIITENDQPSTGTVYVCSESLYNANNNKFFPKYYLEIHSGMALGTPAAKKLRIPSKGHLGTDALCGWNPNRFISMHCADAEEIFEGFIICKDGKPRTTASYNNWKNTSVDGNEIKAIVSESESVTITSPRRKGGRYLPILIYPSHH